MRIGLVIYDDLDSISGGYLYDRKLTQYLINRGDQVEVISLPSRNYALHMLDNLSPGLLKNIKERQFDVLLQDELNHPSLFILNRLFSHGLYTPQNKSSFTLSKAAKRVRYPVISIVHHLRGCEEHPSWQKLFYSFIERLYLNSVNGFIFNSRATKRDLMSAGVNLESCPSIIAYPAGDRLKPEISDDEIIKRARETGPLRLVFLGNVSPRKGLHILLKALVPVSGNLYNLEIIGNLEVDTNYSDKIRRLISHQHMIDSVIIHDYLDDNRLADILRNSHLLVVPSNYEGFGISYLEGMGFGLPAVGTTAGGASEIISHGKNGFLIKPGDTHTLSRLLIDLANDRQMLAEMSMAARRRYMKHPTWDKTCESIRDFLQSISKVSQLE